MSDQQILKEYLLSLGFKIDSTESKKFDTTIGKFDTNVFGLAKRAAAAALAVQAMVAVFARSMEKLYYSSMRAESTAGACPVACTCNSAKACAHSRTGADTRLVLFGCSSAGERATQHLHKRASSPADCCTSGST